MVKLNTLESVANAFAQWRRTRASSNEKVPNTLRQHTVELLLHYKKATVLDALKINHATLKQWQPRSESTPSTFVPLATDLPELVSPSLTITLRNPEGFEMCITGELSAAQLSELAAPFIGYQGKQP